VFAFETKTKIFKGESMNVKFFSRTTILLITLLLMAALAFAGGKAEQKGEKHRFAVGWTSDQAIEHLKPDEGWDYTAMGTTFFPLVYDQLWMLGPAPDYAVIPRLATSWESEDGYTWTFHLRHDAKFHDGHPVTAEDVAFTIEHLVDASEAWAYSDIVSEEGSVKVLDKYTVQFTLEVGMNGVYPPMGFKPILPKHIWKDYVDDMMAYDNDPLIGGGPFKVKEFVPGEYILLEANDDYYAGRPAADEVLFRIFGNRESMSMALRRGEIQMLGRGASIVAALDLGKEENIDVIETKGETSWALGFNLHKETPLRDLEVRKAIMHAIDRQRIIDIAYLGYAEIVDTTFTYPEMPEYNPNLPQYEYDPVKARAILDGAGYIDTDGDGIRNDPATGMNLSFELLCPADWTDEVKAGTMMKEMLPEVGILLDLKTVDEDTYYTFTEDEVEEDKYEMGFIESGPSPYGDWIWETVRSAGLGEDEEGGWNQSYYINPKLDELIDEMLVESDIEKKYALHREIQAILAQDIPLAALWRPEVLCPVRTDKWEGYTPAMGGISSWINSWSMINARPKE
jgi:peptide/nickel transport system substrate-binding protein